MRFSRIRVHASSFWTLERFLPHVFADERGEQRTNERTGRYFGEWRSAVICCRHLFKLRALQASNRYRI